LRPKWSRRHIRTKMLIPKHLLILCGHACPPCCPLMACASASSERPLLVPKAAALIVLQPIASLQFHGRVAFLPFAAVTRKSLISPPFYFAPQTLGEHVRHSRLSRRLTQRSVAKTIGVGAATLLNWEKGKTDPSDKSLPAILKFLGYDPLPAPSSLPERLMALRRSLGWSAAEAARQIGVYAETWRAWECGATILHRSHREQIATLLNLPPAAVHLEMGKRWNESHRGRSEESRNQ
jgi:transcriptional regulator with XRE-family HTH domain